MTRSSKHAASPTKTSKETPVIEQEHTYLAERLPDDLDRAEHVDIEDAYIPASDDHPVLRLRRKDDTYRMTKKEPTGDDKSEQREQTIALTEDEYQALRQAPSKDLRKTRYYYDWNGRTAEIDVFHGDLDGLVLVDKNMPETRQGNNEMNAYAQIHTVQSHQSNPVIIGTSSEGHAPDEALTTIDKTMNATEDLHDALQTL
jgi:CYTH domain-containing protein